MLEQSMWKHAATFAVTVHDALPVEAQAGLVAAFVAARQSEPLNMELQSLQGQFKMSHLVMNQLSTLYESTSKVDDRITELSQGLGGGVHLMMWMKHQVAVFLIGASVASLLKLLCFKSHIAA